MGLNIPIIPGFSLNFGDPLPDQKYPTAHLQKGFILLDEGVELTEEAVGFGVPVVKRGLQTIFPGDVSLTWQKEGTTWVVTAQFKLNLVEKITRGGNGNVGNGSFYALKDFLAEVIRRFPIFRRLLTNISSLLRRIFNWKTNYAAEGALTEVKVNYTIEAGTGKTMVDIDLSDLPADLTEVVVMNEQGAHAFDRYQDTSGNYFQGEEVGCWDEVEAEEAWFESSARRVAFGLSKVKGARLFRGRELIGSRLAWAGFGYSFPPSIQRFQYEFKIKRLA
ncbi:MAG: hypothetical protein ABSG01_08550 [Anaerolineales bacterium]|jgi:hypothetical protein